MHFSNLIFPNGDTPSYFIFLLIYKEKYMYFVLPDYYGPMNWDMTGYEDTLSDAPSENNRYGIKILNEQTIDLLLHYIQHQEIPIPDLKENLDVFKEVCDTDFDVMYALPLIVINFDKKLFSIYNDDDVNLIIIALDNLSMPKGWRMAHSLIECLNNVPIEHRYWLEIDLETLHMGYNFLT